MFKKLLVPLDRSPLAEQAIGQAVAIARASHAAVDVVLVNHPVPYSGFDAAPLNEALWKVEHKYIETITDEISSGGVVPATHSIMSGDVVDRTRNGSPTVTESSSTSHRAGLPVVGGSQPGIRWIGRTSRGASRSKPCRSACHRHWRRIASQCE